MMIGFFEALGSSGLIPLSSIERVGPARVNEHGVALWPIHRSGCEPFDLFPTEVDELRLRPVQLIPCAHQLRTISMGVDQHTGEDWHLSQQVIAWALCVDGQVRPVTASGVENDLNFCVYVQWPDGRIEGVGPEADSFDSEVEMRKAKLGSKEDALDGL